jgi:predicted amino acid racemase
MLRELGVEVTQVNAPSVTCAATIPLLATRGATHGEPGSALTGSTPLHAVSRQPETPAVVYVSEVMTVQGSRAYCLGGGFYARSRVSQALIGDPAADPLLAAVDPLPAESIDYYGTLDLPPGADVHLGDTVLFAFRSQVFVSRSRVAAVAGIASGNPRVLGICDAAGNLLGEDLLPLGSTQARDRVAAAWQSYALAHKVPRQNLPVSVRAKGPGDPG